jgi:CheY-like chemotaxis protein
VVYGIVRQNGGFIQVHSEIGSGSTFEVFFPITAEPAEPGRALDDEGAAEGGEETLILVEDESLVREIVSEALSGLGYTVLSCATGEQALEEVARHQGAIHLLLTDVVLPGMSGRELATRLAERRPEIKVLFTSGHAEDVLGPHGVLDSSTHFIGKPYSPESLARKVRDVLGS